SSADLREELLTAEHPLEFLTAFLVAEGVDARVGRIARDLLHAEVSIRDARDLGEVRDRHDLRTRGEAAQRFRDAVRGLAADACVDLVEHHRLAACNSCNRKRDS